MSFDFFFGLFGLLCGNSKYRSVQVGIPAHGQEAWQAFHPLDSSLFRAPHADKSSSTASGNSVLDSYANATPDFTLRSSEKSTGIFSIAGNASLYNVSDQKQTGSASSQAASSTKSSSNAATLNSGASSPSLGSTGSTKSATTTTTGSTINLINSKQGDEAGAMPRRYALFGSKSNKVSAADLNADSKKKKQQLHKRDIEFDDDDLCNADDLDEYMASTRKLPAKSTGSLAADDKEYQEALKKPAADAAKQSGTSPWYKWRLYYCRAVCLAQWIYVCRILLGFFYTKSLFTLDFYYLGSHRAPFLVPAMCLAVQCASLSCVFFWNSDETNWLVPFFSSKDFLVRSRSDFRPKMSDYNTRINVMIGIALTLATLSWISMSAFFGHIIFKSKAMHWLLVIVLEYTGNSHLLLESAPEVYSDGVTEQSYAPTTTTRAPPLVGEHAELLESMALSVLLVTNVVWSIYMAYIGFLVACYFNLICSIMRARFHNIARVIEELAETNTSRTTQQARKITTLYLDHNEACELLDESNEFWQYLIFFTYFTYIPAYCYCLYNIFFVDFDSWNSFIAWTIQFHTGLIILIVSFSAANVSTQVSWRSSYASERVN